MNSKAWITLFLLFGWMFFCWYWIRSQKKLCCGPAQIQTHSLSTRSINIPIYYTLGSGIPKKGSDFDQYKRNQLADMGPFDTLLIHGWYFSNETQEDSLAKARAENLKPFFQDIADNRIKITVDKHLGNMDPSSDGFEAASFTILHKAGSLVQKLKDKILIYFPLNSSAKKIDPEIDQYLDSLAKDLKLNIKTQVQITGYTDSTGESISNITLSKKRADFVKTSLMAKGIDSSRVKSEGLGSANPLADNHNPEGRSKNRRVELSLINP